MDLAVWSKIITILDIGTTQNVPDKLCQTSGCYVTSHFVLKKLYISKFSIIKPLHSCNSFNVRAVHD